jgi:hypothetical protein
LRRETDAGYAAAMQTHPYFVLLAAAGRDVYRGEAIAAALIRFAKALRRLLTPRSVRR